MNRVPKNFSFSKIKMQFESIYFRAPRQFNYEFNYIKNQKKREPLPCTPSIDARALRNETSTILVKLHPPYLNALRLCRLYDEQLVAGLLVARMRSGIEHLSISAELCDRFVPSGKFREQMGQLPDAAETEFGPSDNDSPVACSQLSGNLGSIHVALDKRLEHTKVRERIRGRNIRPMRLWNEHDSALLEIESEANGERYPKVKRALVAFKQFEVPEVTGRPPRNFLLGILVHERENFVSAVGTIASLDVSLCEHGEQLATQRVHLDRFRVGIRCFLAELQTLVSRGLPQKVKKRESIHASSQIQCRFHDSLLYQF